MCPRALTPTHMETAPLFPNFRARTRTQLRQQKMEKGRMHPDVLFADIRLLRHLGGTSCLCTYLFPIQLVLASLVLLLQERIVTTSQQLANFLKLPVADVNSLCLPLLEISCPDGKYENNDRERNQVLRQLQNLLKKLEADNYLHKKKVVSLSPIVRLSYDDRKRDPQLDADYKRKRHALLQRYVATFSLRPLAPQIRRLLGLPYACYLNLRTWGREAHQNIVELGKLVQRRLRNRARKCVSRFYDTRYIDLEGSFWASSPILPPQILTLIHILGKFNIISLEKASGFPLRWFAEVIASVASRPWVIAIHIEQTGLEERDIRATQTWQQTSPGKRVILLHKMRF